MYRVVQNVRPYHMRLIIHTWARLAQVWTIKRMWYGLTLKSLSYRRGTSLPASATSKGVRFSRDYQIPEWGYLLTIVLAGVDTLRISATSLPRKNYSFWTTFWRKPFLLKIIPQRDRQTDGHGRTEGLTTQSQLHVLPRLADLMRGVKTVSRWRLLILTKNRDHFLKRMEFNDGIACCWFRDRWDISFTL